MSLTDEERSTIVAYRMEKADVAMEDANQLSEWRRWSAAANRLYYAIYYAATALLINNGHITRTHAGMITQISVHFVKAGVLSRED